MSSPESPIARPKCRSRRIHLLKLLEVARDPQHLGAEIGFFSVLHTLESETRTSSACSLCRSRRWTLCRPHALDQITRRLLSSRQSTESRLPRQVPRGTQTRLRERPTPLSWRLEAPRSAQNLCCLAATTVPKRLGGLRETTLRRPRVCAPLSGPLHSSRSHLQSPTGLFRRPESHLSLA